jgi:hypothetical protein
MVTVVYSSHTNQTDTSDIMAMRYQFHLEFICSTNKNMTH